MGVAEHKVIKNEACSKGVVEWWGGSDFVSATDRRRRPHRRDSAAGRRRPRADAVDQPDRDRVLQGAAGADDPQRGRRQPAPARPGGVAPTPCATSPTRPWRAGAPDGCVQVVEEPTIPLIEALMSDPTTDVIVATGGTAVVRAAYRSGNPGLGRRAGQRPGAGRCHGRPGRGRAKADGLEELRQLDPLHQRVVRDRRGARRRRLPEGARSARRPRAHARGRRSRARGRSTPRAGCASSWSARTR